jgi:hypothetical protein
VVLDDEAVTLPNLRHRRRSAELRFLDRPARDADEVVVMAGLAGDEAAAVETADAGVRLEQRERPVDGCQTDRPARLAGRGPELLGGEGVLLLRDELGQQRALPPAY